MVTHKCQVFPTLKRVENCIFLSDMAESDPNLENMTDNSFQCEKCPSIFTTVGHLLKHNRIHMKGIKV